MTILANLLEFNATYNKQLLRFMFQFCIKSFFFHLSYKEREQNTIWHKGVFLGGVPVT